MTNNEQASMTEPNTIGGGFASLSGHLETPPYHVPDGRGGAYKTELALFRSPERTEKILWWHADDPRSEPHNHPWRFESTILSGGYSEHRWWLDENGELQTETCTYRAGDINVVERHIFHVVFDVQPKTVTQLLCGPATEGNRWGYLDLATKTYTDAESDPQFLADLRALNPHLRPRTEPTL